MVYSKPRKEITIMVTLFDTLLEDIRRHPNRGDAERIALESRLRGAVYDGLRSYLPTWKRNGNVSIISIICALPASSHVVETTADYERLVYGSAAHILL